MTTSPAWYAAYGELHRLLLAYAGEAADDGSGVALIGYLRHTSPASAAVAASQARAFGSAEPDPDVLGVLPRLVDGSGVEATTWLAAIADRLDQAVEHGYPPLGPPATHWEWNTRFPVLGQLLGCYFTQDFPAEFNTHQAAVDRWLLTADAVTRARLSGEIGELLTLDLEPIALLAALTELGLEVEPPTDPHTWLDRILG